MIDIPTKHKFTVASLFLMEETGILPPDHRTELLNGELIDIFPSKPPTRIVSVCSIASSLKTYLPTPTLLVSAQNPMQLSEHSRPNPTCWWPATGPKVTLNGTFQPPETIFP